MQHPFGCLHLDQRSCHRMADAVVNFLGEPVSFLQLERVFRSPNELPITVQLLPQLLLIQTQFVELFLLPDLAQQ
ncbi:hypothetical protein D3C73_1549770 [compost metagenome]